MKTAHHLYTFVHCPLTLSSFKGHLRWMNNDPGTFPGSPKHRRVLHFESKVETVEYYSSYADNGSRSKPLPIHLSASGFMVN